MVLILIALLSVICIAAYCAQKDVWISFFHELVCPIFVVLGFVGLFIYCIAGYGYIAADYKKDIINREYGTKYTREEVFYASNVIDTIRNLERSRVEINGNILKDK